MIISYSLYSLLKETLTKGDIMKKFILFSILSVLFYSAPGHAGKRRGGTKAAAVKAAELRSEGFILREAGALEHAKAQTELAAANEATGQQLIRRALANCGSSGSGIQGEAITAERDVMMEKEIQRKIEAGKLPTLEEATKQDQGARLEADDAEETSCYTYREMDVAAEKG